MNIKCRQDSDCQQIQNVGMFNILILNNLQINSAKCDRGECCAPPSSISGGTNKVKEISIMILLK